MREYNVNTIKNELEARPELLDLFKIMRNNPELIDRTIEDLSRKNEAR